MRQQLLRTTDLGAGPAWSAPALGLSAEVAARGLLTRKFDGFRDLGLSGSLAWDPDPSDRGPSLTVTQTLGGTASGGMQALLGRETLAGLPATDDPLQSRRLDIRAGYGFAVFGDRFTATGVRPGAAAGAPRVPHRMAPRPRHSRPDLVRDRPGRQTPRAPRPPRRPRAHYRHPRDRALVTAGGEKASLSALAKLPATPAAQYTVVEARRATHRERQQSLTRSSPTTEGRVAGDPWLPGVRPTDGRWSR